MKRLTLSKLILTATIALFIQSCNTDADVDSLVGSTPDVIEVPLDLQITITSPSADGKKVGYSGQLSGSCNQPGQSIEIRGQATGYSVCQSDNTWTSQIDFSGAAVGSVTVQAYLVDNARESAGATRIFTKDSTDCDTTSARAAQYAGGDGSAGNPWMICTSAQLNNVRIKLNDNYIVKNDIDLNSNPFIPIPSVFRGIFDGNGFSIQNLYIYDLSGADVALFKQVRDATIKDLTLENFNVSGPSVVAGLVGRVVVGFANISNITANGKAIANSSWVGGLIAYVDNGATLSVTNADVTATLNGQSRLGIILGGTHASASSVTLDTITVAGSATGTDSYVGGAAGLLDTINNTLNDITSSVVTVAYGASGTVDSYVGGIAGRMDGGDITTCSSSGTVTGTGSFVGGVVGQYGGAKLYNCDVTGAISVDTTNRAATGVGGLIGQATTSNTDIFQCSVKANINVTGTLVGQQIGGGVGFFRGIRFSEVSIDGDTTAATRGILNVITGNGTTTGGTFIGGAIGYLQIYSGDTLTIDNTYANVDVTNETATANSQTGGFVGYMANQDAAAANDIIITDTYASGDVVSNNRYVGGFAGNMYTARAGSTISMTNVYASGNVTVDEINTTSLQYIGGFAGSATTRDNGGDVTTPTGGYQLSNVYASGNVTITATSVGGERVGGLIGYLHTGRSGGTGGVSNLSKVYATGNINVTSGLTYNYVGGLIGYLNSSTLSTIAIDSSAGQSYATGNVSVTTGGYIGGGFGYATITTSSTFTLDDFYSNGNVSGDTKVGGLAGQIYVNAAGGTIALDHIYSHDNSSVTPPPTVTATGAQVGGLIGLAGASNTSTISLSNCSAISTVTGTNYAGGLIGYDHDSLTITGCTASGDVSGVAPYVGGLTGGSDRNGRNYSQVYASGDVTAAVPTATAQGYVGGLVGRISTASSVYKAVATGDIIVDVDSTATLTEAYTGGLIGYMQGTVDQSYATGNVSVTNPTLGTQSYVGGLLGRGTALVSNSFATGDVQGGYYVGGLIGYHRGGVQNSFAAGNINGTLNVGGLIGNYDGSAGSVSKVYSLGSVTRIAGTQTNRFGPLIGYCNAGVGDTKVQDGYYNLSTSTVDANITSPETNCNSNSTNETRGIANATMLTPGTGFTGFDFISTNPSDWRFAVTFKKKGVATVYPYPVLYWLEN